ncbi:putative C6 transcription factor Prf [Talaromyces proteolyticus]|uniref:C6 transcription factor Prf n=1 Tax=Talaromyces proteolyticus TaxID=1131652 RepID=A0AAD4KVA0_9EURO|nr:putative C6 transcription factor Prf [Talaromyces proteolyticus]KAH8697506.1 putative C6 transcription factor Prf [Talaromyces proteolyticus]
MTSRNDSSSNEGSGEPMSQDSFQPQRGNAGGNTNEDDNNFIPRPKRMACVICRKRKLKCDGIKPTCGTCARVGHNCAYDEVRKKSGPKRGYVKQLEARLAQVETFIRNKEPENPSASRQTPPNPLESFQRPSDISSMSNNSFQQLLEGLGQTQLFQNSVPADSNNSESSWEVISLGLEEPLPTQEVMDELTRLYFSKVHPSTPMIHRPRFYAAMNLAPNMRPPVCLRYIMWALTASITPKYAFLEEHFYARARKYIQLDEMKGHGEHIVSVAHCQAWLLISLYEFKQMLFPRAWISVGRGARLTAMMCFNRLDGVGLDVKHCIPPPRDWIEREERRRTFWIAFCHDRYASIGTGWPMIFDERDIMTNLPASEDAFVTGKAEVAPTLKDVLAGDIANLSPLGSVALMSCIFGLNLTHLHRPDSQDREGDVNGEFWKRHRAYDNILLNISLSLPSSLRLPHGISDPNIIFANMSIHTSTICLHQAAIFKAEKNKFQNQIAAESKRRCIIAADQVASIMKMVSHTDLSLMNPFVAFCLYVAARVFVQYLKSRADDQAVKSSLHFLLTALNALKQYSSLTESFLIQLDVDLAGSEFGLSTTNNTSQKQKEPFDECSTIANIRLENATEIGNTNSPDSRGGSVSSQNIGSVPSRQRGYNLNNPGSTNRSVNSNSNASPGIDENQLWPNNEMNISPSFNLSDNPSGSDKASPATMNSSNAAITPSSMDKPLSTTQPQNDNINKSSSIPDIASFNLDGNDPSHHFSGSTPHFFDTATMNVDIDSTGMENPFALNAGWSHPLEQPTGFEDASLNNMVDDLDPLSNRQFEQMLQGMGWNGWPQ